MTQAKEDDFTVRLDSERSYVRDGATGDWHFYNRNIRMWVSENEIELLSRLSDSQNTEKWLRKIVVDWMAGGFTSPGACDALHEAAWHFGLLGRPSR